MDIFLTTRFPPDLELQARIAAAKRRISRSEFVREAVRRLLAEENAYQHDEQRKREPVRPG